MVKIFANSRDPDQMPHSAASDLGLHCLPVTRLGVFSLQWVKVNIWLLPVSSTHIGATPVMASSVLKTYSEKKQNFNFKHLKMVQLIEQNYIEYKNGRIFL